ncbi:MAG: PPC domain-containing protein, partial [Anaerolineae bacterium]
AACPDPYEPNESFEQAWVIPAGLAVQPYICHSYDWDWFKFQVVAGQQIGAHLVGIPEPWNYELYLYDPNGDVVDWSRHIASSPEHIVLTASQSGWYRLLVFGSEGNADPDHAYSLSVMLSMPTPTVEPASELGAYLEANPRVRDAIALEVREPGVWLAYDSWDASWKTRLREMYEYLAEGRSLPLPDPIPIETHEDYAIGTGKVVYGTQFVARDVYFAHVAHVLLVEVRHLVPWRLSDYSNLELTHLLSSDNLFDAELIYPLEDTLERDLAAEPVFRYTVCYSGCGGTEFGRASESVLSDPRLPYWFMFREPEQGRHLIGNTQTETAIKLTEWFHDFLEHGYADVSWADPYYLQHPYLSDRLRRQSVSFLDHDAYIATWGCWTASALFAELLRSVNVPIKLAETLLQNPDEVTWGRHAGLMYDWQGPEARYLIHTDDIYCCGGHIKDPSPGPGVSRGEALWNHVWLDPGTFGEMFTYDPDPQLLAKATHDQDLRYEAFASWRTASHNNSQPAVYLLCNASRGDALATIMRDGLSQQEAEAAYGAAEAAVRSYGNGDLAAGCDRVAERHTVWCEQTGKCAGG